MPVKIRLTRMGKKKQPTYRVVVVDSRKPRDGAYIEQIGRYDPRAEPSLIEIDNDRALDWLQKGAQPTERAQKLLEISGAWTRFRVAKGDIHTIDETPAPVQAAAPTGHAPEIHVVGGDADDSVDSPDSADTDDSDESPDSVDSPDASLEAAPDDASPETSTANEVGSDDEESS
jgi:small subunit ribosomal protein S16